VSADADPIPRTVSWDAERPAVRLIDQRRLPGSLEFLDCRTVDEVCVAILGLAVRGAPALGATGAYGIALAAAVGEDVERAAAALVATRPTAVNLAWGVQRAVAAWSARGTGAARALAGGAAGALAEAERVADEDVACNRALGAAGAALLGDGARVLTHCNAGSLACVGYGTAVGVIRAAAEAGKGPRVWVDETRPVLQGARLTAWELDRLGIPATLVADVAAAGLMAAGEVDCVIVGADRVAANGDVANKVGTYGLAVLARHHGIPFYVAAPTSTIDLATPDGAAIVVEQRPAEEVTTIAGVRVAPDGVVARNPAFDVTPTSLVTALITEHGLATPPLRSFLSAT
jgi:methylthioribose-1-phosphate isomerase